MPEFKIAKTKNALLKNINYFIKKYKEVVIKPARSRGGRNVFIIRKSFNKEKEIICTTYIQLNICGPDICSNREII